MRINVHTACDMFESLLKNRPVRVVSARYYMSPCVQLLFQAFKHILQLAEQRDLQARLKKHLPPGAARCGRVLMN